MEVLAILGACCGLVGLVVLMWGAWFWMMEAAERYHGTFRSQGRQEGVDMFRRQLQNDAWWVRDDEVRALIVGLAEGKDIGTLRGIYEAGREARYHAIRAFAPDEMAIEVDRVGPRAGTE
jgi:hypothetical protein